MPETPLSFIKRFLTFSIGPIGSATLSFLVVPILTWFVSPEDFGKASMFTLAVTTLNLLVLCGTDQAFTRYFFEKRSKQQLLMDSVFVPTLLSLSCILLIILWDNTISQLLFQEENTGLMVLLAVNIPLRLFNRFSTLLIRMEEKAKLFSFLTIINQFIRLLSILASVYLLPNFQGIIIGETIGIFIGTTIWVFCTKANWLGLLSVLPQDLKKILRFALPILPANIVFWLFTAMDKIALRTWSDFTELGFYAVAFKFAAVLEIMRGAFCTFWVPTAYRWYNTNESIGKYERVGKILSFIVVLLALCIILLRKVIIMILSNSYSNAAILIPFIIFSPILYTLSEVSVVGINFHEKSELHLLISAICCLVNFTGNYFLVPIFGALGASIATAVSFLVFFSMRTLFSFIVWNHFKVKYYFVNITILIFGASLTLFQYQQEFSILIVLIGFLATYNKSQLWYLLATFRRAFSTKKTKNIP